MIRVVKVSESPGENVFVRLLVSEIITVPDILNDSNIFNTWFECHECKNIVEVFLSKGTQTRTTLCSKCREEKRTGRPRKAEKGK